MVIRLSLLANFIPISLPFVILGLSSHKNANYATVRVEGKLLT